MQKQGELFRFDVPEGEKVDFKSFVMRRMRKRDELEASKMARALHGPVQPDDDFQSRYKLEHEERVRFSIVSVDGMEVTQPLLAADDWCSASWDYLRHAYTEVNGADPKKLSLCVGVPLDRLTSTSDLQTSDSQTDSE